MQRFVLINSWMKWTLVALLIAACSHSALAQIGPNPSEIPQAFIPPANQIQEFADSDSLSNSEFVRPAIDEILLAKARAANNTLPVSTPAIAPASVERDINAGTGTMPIGQSKQRSTLIGSPESKAGTAFGIDKGYIQTIASLLGVILLILGLGQVYKRLAKFQGGLAGQLGAGGSAPSGIIEVIGRYPISKGMTLVVLKFDRRVLLLSHATSSKGKWGRAASMDVLCELSDTEDIASILLKMRSAAGDSIAQSFEQTLRDADDLTDEHLRTTDFEYSEVNPVRFPRPRTEPVRTITTDEGDRAELWSSGQDSRAAAGVLRNRLATMRREQQQ